MGSGGLASLASMIVFLGLIMIGGGIYGPFYLVYSRRGFHSAVRA
jgi:hypothetical protein